MIKQEPRQPEFSKRRETAKLRSDTEKSLMAYVCAAAATGVSLLAMTTSADAEVVYTEAHIVIPVNGGPVTLDLNHDGVGDFALWNLATSGGQFPSLYVGCFPDGSSCQNQENEIWGRGTSLQRFASALNPGFLVRPNSSYFQQAPRRRYGLPSPAALMGGLDVEYSYQGRLTSSFTSGQWLNTTNRYLGFQFVISGEIHYGWARLTVDLKGNRHIDALLTGYAYETIPNKPIVTGEIAEPKVSTLEPPSLGRLAQGASGISAWRAGRSVEDSIQ